ncbi:tautomerase family protein [Lysinibacillus sphaericus]|uniref:tautomerase family protein n=1 Tax=Lysinibacillus sphaericus TaxID=1421 RepID=UPI003F79D1BE
MPIATIKTFKGALTNEQKVELHRRFADLMVEIEGKGNEEFRKFVILAIEEEEPINLAIGGVGATEDIMKRITSK